MSTEPFLILIIKKYVWQYVAGFILLGMIHNAIEGYCMDETGKNCAVAKAIVNGLYAIAITSGVLGYKYDEIGLVAGAIIGTVVGYGTLKKMLKDRIKTINQNEM
jgi:hypothetical protein